MSLYLTEAERQALTDLEFRAAELAMLCALMRSEGSLDGYQPIRRTVMHLNTAHMALAQRPLHMAASNDAAFECQMGDAS